VTVRLYELLLDRIQVFFCIDTVVLTKRNTFAVYNVCRTVNIFNYY